MTSGIKELGGVALIILAAALLVLYPPSEGGLRRVVPLSIALAGAVSAFSVGAIPWIGMFALLLFVSELLRAHAHRVRVVGMWVWMTLLAVVLGLPAVVSGVTIAQIATAGGPEGLGNLAAAVPAWSAAGVWLTPDYRFPIADGGAEVPTIIGIVLVLVLAIVGIAWSVRRRLLVYVALGVAGVVALAYVARASATWSDFKAITVTAPFILHARLRRRRGRRDVAPRRSGSRSAGSSSSVSSPATSSSSTARASRPTTASTTSSRSRTSYDGQGPSLYPVFEEYSEYLLRDMDASSLSNPANFDPGWNAQALPGLQFVRDMDEYKLDYLNSLKTIVLRRDPTVEPAARQLAPRRDDAVPRDLEADPGRAADRRPHRLPRRPEGAHEGEEAPEARVHDAAHRPADAGRRRRGALRRRRRSSCSSPTRASCPPAGSRSRRTTSRARRAR